MSTGTIDEHRPPPVLGQSRRMSLVESIANVCVGYAIAVLTQMIVFPWFGLQTTLAENLQIGVLFTIVSIARSFALRRAFEAIRVRSQTGQRAVPEAGSKVNHG